MSEELIQGSDAWKVARLGRVTASRIADVVAKTKTGYGASRANYAAQLIVERLTQAPQESYTNAAMIWGVEQEPEARIAYEFRADVTVREIGFVPHPTIAMSGASPDGLVGDLGLVEIKCPQSATHIDTLLGDEIASKYVMQAQWQMACTKRQWCDFVSFDPRMPEAMRLFVRRIPRDDRKIAELESEVAIFLREIEERFNALSARYYGPKTDNLLMAG